MNTNNYIGGTTPQELDLRSLLSGEDPVAGALVAGLFTSGYRITASGVIPALPPGSLVESFAVLAAGTAGSFQAFDHTTADSGNTITESIAFGSLTVGSVIKRWGFARRLQTGLYLTVPTGAIIIVNAKPAV